ncbi:hypothetical protein TL16_g10157 [Triparma laevis f. inornata]|uniref:Uncharacterized protein n=1 Tax=Triparma laevis f. inornata TaxID=1714386 RepID=A0A9W7B7D0_9STRA|nr:hypothetical protein TL16_g10157 [Triparma laevis f. inornata]
MHVLHACSKLVPSSIDINDFDNDTTLEVVAHLRLQQLLAGNTFLNTDDFRRLIVPHLQNDTLMTIRLSSKPWSRVSDAFISDGVESGTMLVHSGKDISWMEANARKERRALVTRVIFLLNITKVGENACYLAANLVIVDIPEGVESIGVCAYGRCSRLTTVSFPTTLKSIG